MTTSSSDLLIRELHQSAARLVLAATGGGSLAISDLLVVPGASRTLLEAAVPYSAAALAAWLGARPEQYCSEPTARVMAMAAYRRAVTYSAGEHLVGAACTASLASDRPKRGPHRAYVAVQTATATASFSLELAKGRRSRAEEERVVADLLLNAVAEAAGISQRLELSLLDAEHVASSRVDAPGTWQELLAGTRDLVQYDSQPATVRPAKQSKLVFPGAFNPLHEGHLKMASIAAAKVGAPADFELSITNVDKPPLDFIEIQKRGTAFGRDRALWLTRAATFLEKARLFPGATFVVGVDTIRRIADPRYYGGQAAADAALSELRARGCRFLVFGRLGTSGFETLADVELPEPLRAMSEGVPANEYREDVSSTERRSQVEAD